MLHHDIAIPSTNRCGEQKWRMNSEVMEVWTSDSASSFTDVCLLSLQVLAKYMAYERHFIYDTQGKRDFCEIPLSEGFIG